MLLRLLEPNIEVTSLTRDECRDKEVITGNENNYLAHKLLLITYLTLCTYVLVQNRS